MNQLSHMQVLCICKIGFELNASAVASCGATAAGRLRLHMTNRRCAFVSLILLFGVPSFEFGRNALLGAVSPVIGKILHITTS
jgi:hypothetical protein